MNGLMLSKVPRTPWVSRPPLGACRIGVAHPVEARGQRRLAVHGDGVLGRAGPRLCRSRGEQRERAEPERGKRTLQARRTAAEAVGIVRVGSHGSSGRSVMESLVLASV